MFAAELKASCETSTGGEGPFTIQHFLGVEPALSGPDLGSSNVISLLIAIPSKFLQFIESSLATFSVEKSCLADPFGSCFFSATSLISSAQIKESVLYNVIG